MWSAELQELVWGMMGLKYPGPQWKLARHHYSPGLAAGCVGLKHGSGGLQGGVGVGAEDQEAGGLPGR